MIDIQYTEGPRLELSIKGHAGHDVTGKDIVCAGVTAITFALIGYLEAEEPTGADVHLSAEDSETTRALFEMAVIGYQQIEAVFPNNVRVTITAIGG